MNTARLRSLLKQILEDEAELAIQAALQALNSALSNLAQNPQDPNFQVAVGKQLETLQQKIEAFNQRYDPASLEQMQKINAAEFFQPVLLETIENSIRKNGMTPAVAQQAVKALLNKRGAYVQALTDVERNFSTLGIGFDEVAEGEGEINFKIPRTLFNNNLAGLITELREIRFIVRAFSEMATGDVEELELKQISTSDPLFSFAMDPITLAQIGGAVTWALLTWKQIEEIRKLRRDARNIKVFSKDDIEKMFDSKIKELVAQAVSEKRGALLEEAAVKNARKPELETALGRALESLLARIERGMTIEVRFLPRSAEEGKEVAVDVEEAALAARIEDIRSRLSFPARDPDPIVALPAPQEDSPEKGGKKKG